MTADSPVKSGRFRSFLRAYIPQEIKQEDAEHQAEEMLARLEEEEARKAQEEAERLAKEEPEHQANNAAELKLLEKAEAKEELEHKAEEETHKAHEEAERLAEEEVESQAGEEREMWEESEEAEVLSHGSASTSSPDTDSTPCDENNDHVPVQSELGSASTSSPDTDSTPCDENNDHVPVQSDLDHDESMPAIPEAEWESETMSDAEVLAGGLYALRAEGRFCDIMLMVGDKSFPAHQVVLSTASVSFSRYIAKNAQKLKLIEDAVPKINETGSTPACPGLEVPQALKVEFECITEPRAMDIMLSHVYGQEIPRNQWPAQLKVNLDVLRLAACLHLPRLQARADEWLILNVTVSNFADIVAVCNELELHTLQKDIFRLFREVEKRPAPECFEDHPPKRRIRGKRTSLGGEISKQSSSS